MFERYQAAIDRLIHAAIQSPSDTTAALRETIVSYGKSQIGAPGSPLESLPSELVEFADKATFSLQSIGDDDIAALQAAGYSDDSILDIINCAALAAGIGRLEIVFAAMRGEVKRQ